MLSNEILVLAGITISGFLTYLGTTYKFRHEKSNDPNRTLFEYQQQLLDNVWEQNKQKDALISKLETSMDKIQQELYETRRLLAETKVQLAEATKANAIVQENILNAREAVKHMTAGG